MKLVMPCSMEKVIFHFIIRNNLAPIASIGARFVWILILLGFVVSYFFLELGIMLYVAIVLFQVVTLPVEFNASRRALYQLENFGIVYSDEIGSLKGSFKSSCFNLCCSYTGVFSPIVKTLSLTGRRRN